MGLKRTTPPSAEPVSLDQARTHLRVTDEIDDDTLVRLIKSSREECELRVRRTLMASTWTLTLDSFAELREIRMPPVTAVQSISYIDASGETQVLNPDTYTVKLLEDEPALVKPLQSWPVTKQGFDVVQVVYTAGYATADVVPGPLVDWILLAIGDRDAYRERSQSVPPLPTDFADRLLDGYKVWP
jgi:uncharacterized phiE125 gp8 family phage protein